MPITGNTKAPTYARLGVARLGAFRLNYYRPLTLTIAFNGSPAHVRIQGLSVRDILDGEPNIATMRVDGSPVPIQGQDVAIGLGTLEPAQLLFAGKIQMATLLYETDDAKNTAYDLTCISWEWLLNRRTISTRFLNASVSTIAASIIAGWTQGFTTRGIDPGLPVLAEFTLTNESVTGALDRLAKRIGAYWYIDTDRDLKFFISPPLSATPITNTDPASMRYITRSIDLDPVRTRAIVEAGGSAVSNDVAAGDTMIPVDDVAWYESGGGLVQIGPRIVNYGGVVVAAGGAIIGTGVIAPTQAPTPTPAIGLGLNSGTYRYKVTYATATGETVAGPASAPVVTGGVVGAPTAPSATRGTVGGNLSPGAYRWLVTYGDALGGETVASPASEPIVLGPVTPPGSAPTAAIVGTAGNLGAGAYRYKVTFRIGSNETMAGAASTAATITGVANPSTAPSGVATGTAGNVNGGTHRYKVTYVTAAGETLASAASAVVSVWGLAPPALDLGSFGLNTGGNLSSGIYWWATTHVDAAGRETTRSPLTGPFEFSPEQIERSITWNFDPASMPAGVVARRVYRTAANTPPLPGQPTLGQLRYVGQFTATAFFDNVADGDRGPQNPPAENTAGNGRVTVTIPVSADPRVTARRIYRTVAGGGGAYKLVAQVGNNTSTTYEDNVADASLGANEPSVNESASGRINLSGIPVSSDPTVTSRRIYRTAADGATFLLLTTINDNETTTYADNTADGSLGAGEPSVATADYRKATVTIPTSSDPNITRRYLYRTLANGLVFKLAAQINNNVSTTTTDDVADAALGVSPPTSPTTVYNRVSLVDIPVSPDVAVTLRKLYRTIANGSVYKLVTTIANNTAQTYTDSTPDGSLGPDEPAAGGSGLTIADGVVQAGATTIPMTSTGPFRDAGGWARIQSQVIRYTGKTANTLTGIPSSGIGALGASVRYGNEILPASMLIGVPATGTGAIPFTIQQGEDINVRIVRNDVPAQVVMAGLVGGDGVHEVFVQDRRLTATEAANRGDAKLLELKDPIQTIQYETRDLATRSGRSVTIQLAAPHNVNGTFKIQSVTITQFDALGLIRPLRTVTASSRRDSLEAILRILKKREQ